MWQQEIIQLKQDFKNCIPFDECLTKIDGTTVDHAKDLQLVMLMYNLLEYSSSYSDRTGSLWSYSKDQADNFDAGVANNDHWESFKYNAKLLGNTEIDGGNIILRKAIIY